MALSALHKNRRAEPGQGSAQVTRHEHETTAIFQPPLPIYAPVTSRDTGAEAASQQASVEAASTPITASFPAAPAFGHDISRIAIFPAQAAAVAAPDRHLSTKFFSSAMPATHPLPSEQRGQTTPLSAPIHSEIANISTLPRVQASAVVNQPDDPQEREADQIADAIARDSPDEEEPLATGAQAPLPGIQGKIMVQRMCAQCEAALSSGEGELCDECAAKLEPEGPGVQRRAVEPTPEPSAPDLTLVNEVLRSGGQPLGRETRTDMERRFGHDFSRVRVHTDERAAESARSINAFAYTAGEQIAFGAGRYAPDSAAGRWLLAHELTHVVQQRAASGQPIQRQGEPSTNANSDEEQRKLIKEAKTPSDVKSINPFRFTLADEADKLRLINILIDQFWVGMRDEYYLERIWASWGKDLWDIAPKYFELWNKCIEKGADLNNLSELVVVVEERFKADARARVQGYLKTNRDFITQERQRYGLDQPNTGQEQGPRPGQPQANGLTDLQTNARQAADMERQQAVLETFTVGYNRKPALTDDPHWNDNEGKQQFDPALFDPNKKPDRGPWPDEPSPMPNWEDTNKHYQRLESSIRGIAKQFPALYGLRRDGKLGQVANEKNEAELRKIVAASLQGVLDNIQTTETKISDPGDTLVLQMHPIHKQLFEEPGSPWSSPFRQGVAKRALQGHEEAEWWRSIGVGAMQMAIFAVASLATGGAAIFLMAAGTGIGVVQAEKSWEEYLAKAAASQANLSPETQLLEEGEASGALVSAVIDSVAAFIDIFSLGAKAASMGAKSTEAGVKALEQKLAAAEARLEGQVASEAEAAAKERWNFTDGVTGEVHQARATPHGLEICTHCDLIQRRMRERFNQLPGKPSAETAEVLEGYIKKAEANSNAWAVEKTDMDKLLAEKASLEKSQGSLTARQKIDYNQRQRAIQERMGTLQDASQKLEENFEALVREHKVRQGIEVGEGYTSPYGASDEAVRSGLGLGAKDAAADIVSHNQASGRWIIGESKGDDLAHAISDQLQGTYNALIQKQPSAKGNVDFRIYPSQPAYDKLTSQTGLGLSQYKVDGNGFLTQGGSLVQIDGQNIRILPPPK